jgi:hypothetical protein
MKKVLFTMTVVIGLVALTAGTALAGSWWTVNTQTSVDDWNAEMQTRGWDSELSWTVDDLGTGFWADATDNSGASSPHGNFTSTTNYCKTCHAVHLAGEQSWRLLKYSSDPSFDRVSGEGAGGYASDGAGTDRTNECMYCHSASGGMTNARPYALGLLTDVRGEHTIGATEVPGSDVNGGANDTGNLGRSGSLQCHDCHSVHGANTIQKKIADGWQLPAGWGSKILRLDPAGNGVDMAAGALGADDLAADFTSTTLVGGATIGSYAIRVGFCSDCHNLNPNYDTDDADGQDELRPNPRSHVASPYLDTNVEVDGAPLKVAGGNPRSCMSCHNSGTTFNSPPDAGSLSDAFPHQSRGQKLLGTGAMLAGPDVSGVINDAGRETQNMDGKCAGCHVNRVGVTF